jgi:DNA polymerase (family 10)
MPVHNLDIANYFREMADLLDIQGANQYRVRAYRNAARNIQVMRKNLRDIADDKEALKKLPGIGEDLAKKIQVIVKTGELPQLDKLKAELPAGLLEMLDIEGLGPKRVKQLYQELGIENKAELMLAAQDGRIQKLEGFGEKIENNILQRLKAGVSQEERTLRIEAQQVVEPYLAYLKKSHLIRKLAVAGSYRRKKETVGDIDLLAVGKDGEKIGQLFVDYEDVQRILNQGETKSSVVLKSGLQVDLRVVAEKSFGAALQYFTGSRNHNIALRQIAMDQGYKLNEYGLFKKGKQEKFAAGESEEEIYKKLGLDWMPPELRESRGEIEAAQEKRLPSLVTMDEIKGDLQMHTTASDGRSSLKEMAQAAIELGYEYIAISDHSQNLKVAHGLDKKRFRRQFKQIDEFNQSQDKIRVLKAAEVDILKDGSLDLDEEILSEFDLVLCSIHSHFNLSEEEQTKRVLTAMQSPYFHIFAHPTGRLLNAREAYELDMDRVMRAAKENGVILEVNAQPTRLDLDDVMVQKAIEMGIKISLGTDAHSTEELEYMQLGVDQARRGWAETADVVNTLGWEELPGVVRGR